jgi:polyisoprenyl-phosphate glycosyltransferase
LTEVQLLEDGIEISVVVPVYGCDTCLENLHERLTKVLQSLKVPYELVLVDDRSPDASWRVLTRLAEQDTNIRLLRMSRNFGQHAAITAGLEHSRGRWVVVMDCDLQDSPETISEFYAQAQEGFQVVLGRRSGGERSLFRRMASRAYFAVLNRVAGTQMSADHGNFSMISRQVVEAFLRFRDKERHYLMIVYWLGFERAVVDFPHRERHSGKSTYTIGKLLRFALDGLFFQTTTLLRWIVYLGFSVAALGMALAAALVVNFFVGEPLEGWTSIGVLLLVVGGVIILSTGVAGLYIGRIFVQVRDRPLYVIDAQPATSPGPGLRAEMAPETVASGGGPPSSERTP